MSTRQLRAGLGKNKFIWKGARFTNTKTEKQPTQKQPTKGAESMNTLAEKAKAPPQEKRHFTRRIGSTTFRVAVHFNPESKESAGDKISRLIRLEADKGKAVST